MTDEQIKYMRDRFLNWELPKTLNPDGGITFKRSESAIKYNHPWPVGTNFLNADEAEAMVRHMVEGLPYAGDSEGYESTFQATPQPVSSDVEPLDVAGGKS